ncbi:hypothetical protein [Streptomyces lavendulae]
MVPGQGRVLLAEARRLARVGRAAVACWRHQHSDLPNPAAGTDTDPEFD